MGTNKNQIKFPDVTKTGKQLMEEPSEKTMFLVEGMMQKVGLACIAGSSDTGKSLFLRQFAIAIVTKQKEFLGRRINAEHHRALCVITEDLESETKKYLKKQAQSCSPDLLEELEFIFYSENLLQSLEKKLHDKKTDLVVIDCFGDLFNGKLNDSTSVRQWLQSFHNLALRHQCLILFLHHTGKRTEYITPSKNHLLGSQAFEAKMRLVMEFRMDNSDANLRHLCIVKGNYLSSSDKQKSIMLRLDEVTLTFSDTGKRVPFELLVKGPGIDRDREKFDIANMLKKQGKNYDEIANEIGFKSKGSITKLFDKAKERGWDQESEEEDPDEFFKL